MNTKELRDKIGNSSFSAIIKHPYYKEHLYSSQHEPEYHHETTASGSHSTIRADVPFGGKKKTITFQYHKNKVYNAHYALDGKHIRSHKEVNESMENIQELSAKVIQSYLNKLKAKKRAEQEKKEPVAEAKIGDKVQVTHGSQKGLVGHVGEIRTGLGGRDHTYTVDYDDNGSRQSVQVKKAHTKVIKEASIHSSYMARGKSGMTAKAPNASDKPDYGTYNVTVKHEGGEKTYKLKNMKEPKHAMNTAQKIHRKDNPEHKIKDVTYEKLSEENIQEVSKKLLGRYIEKSATSMATAAFGQGQSSANRQPPREKDQKTGFKRMVGIARATSKLTKEETIHEETSASLKKMSDYHAKEAEYHDKHAMNKDHSVERRKGHALARSSHYSATENYLKASRADNDMDRQYYIDKAEKHADAAEAREREHKLMEGVEQVNELKKSTLSSYLNKTVDPDLGLPKDTKKPAQRIKGIERASKKVMSKVNEEVELKPHQVSVQLKHPHYEGVTRKIVKVNASSTKHAEDIVSTHYGRRGFKVHKVDYSKLHKEQFPKNAQEKAADAEKKEDNKIKKIASAIKDAAK